ncbi:PIN domain-containing protein [Gammaproteobacteria bacterium AB-CW1]|uniref:PIN domain-containing protein n=1 Tax=Natronospira elongata TaxID=3110268 RepID=A0AAP6JGV1_9GAMM|nr:PIN domain-containing protein [Gammaproteobacteria bacterium AB-CW1]
MRLVVVYDACVLYPAPLRDFLIRLAGTGLFAAKWTDRIHDEWIHSLLMKRPDLESRLSRTRELMNTAVPDSLVTGYEEYIDLVELPDPDDRHVVAAAIRSSAQIIVTTNLKDFPESALQAHDLEAVHPDEFSIMQMDLNEGQVVRLAHHHRMALKNPPKSPEEYLDTLRSQGLVATADRLSAYQDLL